MDRRRAARRRGLQQRQRVGLIAQLPKPALPRLAGSSHRQAPRAVTELVTADAGRPVHEVEPQLSVVKLSQAIVTEQVGVTEHDDAPLAVPGATISGAPGLEAVA